MNSLACFTCRSMRLSSRITLEVALEEAPAAIFPPCSRRSSPRVVAAGPGPGTVTTLVAMNNRTAAPRLPQHPWARGDAPPGRQGDYAAAEVPDLVDLPAILKWEISLALLVLAWSLLSLGRYERLKGRWWARRSVHPPNVIRLPGARPPLLAPRRHRLKFLVMATGFATAAASFAYAMPNILVLEHRQRGREGVRQASGRGVGSPRPPSCLLAGGYSWAPRTRARPTMAAPTATVSPPASTNSVRSLPVTGSTVRSPSTSGSSTGSLGSSTGGL